MNLKTRFTLGTIFLVTLAAVSVGGITILSDRKLLEKEIETNHKEGVNQLAQVCEESFYQDNLVFFNYVRTLKKKRGFMEAGFVDKKGIVRLHSDPKQLDSLAAIAHESVLSYTAPVTLSGQPVGEAHIWIDRAEIQQFLNQSLFNNLKRIGLITLIVMGFSFLFSLAFAKAMVGPIQRVVHGMREISKGRREPIEFPKRKDELGWMGEELNHTIKRLKEVDEMKETFVASITHDLKSPLKAIQGFVTRLFSGKDNVSPERKKDYLLIIQNNADRLMSLIDNLLITSRLEGGKEELECRLYDIRESIQEVERLFQPLAEEKGLSLTTNLPKKVTHIWADKDKVSHILNNLVSNGIKYTTRGSVEIDVHGQNGVVHVSVSDTGSGIPASDKTKIFDKFYRSPSNADLAKGTGLGLSIVKGFVEAQGGRITVKDNETKGTVISFTLPSHESI